MTLKKVALEIGMGTDIRGGDYTKAAVRALKGGATHYGPAAGIPELRAAVAEDTVRRRGIRATPEMVWSPRAPSRSCSS